MYVCMYVCMYVRTYVCMYYVCTAKSRFCLVHKEELACELFIVG